MEEFKAAFQNLENSQGNKAPAAPSAPVAPSEPKPLRPPGILVFEDDPDGRVLLVKGLTSYGYRVDMAQTGKEGILLAVERNPGLILLNLHLSGIDGFKILKILKSIEPVRRRPVLAMLDEADKEEVIRAQQAGADYCVSKDLSIHAIHFKIDKFLKEKLPDPPLVFENLRYAASSKADTLTIHIESDLNSAIGKELVALARILIPIHPFTLVFSLGKVATAAIGVIGYLSEVRDMARDCGGKFFLSDVDASKYPKNIKRVLETSFQSQ